MEKRLIAWYERVDSILYVLAISIDNLGCSWRFEFVGMENGFGVQPCSIESPLLQAVAAIKVVEFWECYAEFNPNPQYREGDASLVARAGN